MAMSSQDPPANISKSFAHPVLGLPGARPTPLFGSQDMIRDDHLSSPCRANLPANCHLRERYSVIQGFIPYSSASWSHSRADRWMYSTHVSSERRCKQKRYLSILLLCVLKRLSICWVKAHAAQPYSNVGVTVASNKRHRSFKR